MKEEFKDIPGYNGYQVSNLGRVKSFKRSKVKILKNILNVHGYYYVNLHKEGVNKAPRIHQLVAIAFLNHTPNRFKLVVDHINGDKLDNTLTNLQVITNRQNTSKDKLNCTSKYTGVHFDKQRNKWCSMIYINGSKKNLGRFNTELEAHEKYQNALSEFNKEYKNINTFLV